MLKLSSLLTLTTLILSHVSATHHHPHKPSAEAIIRMHKMMGNELLEEGPNVTEAEQKKEIEKGHFHKHKISHPESGC